MSEDRAMKTIDGSNLPIPLRWHGLEPKEASPTGWAGLSGFQRRETEAFSNKKNDSPSLEFWRTKEKEINHTKM